MTDLLDVWLLGRKAGVLEQQKGRMSFTYDDKYLGDPDTMALSVSMPLLRGNVGRISYKDNVTRSFFAGLLPDDLVRQRLAKLLGISENNSFGLLEAVGGECAGAITILPSGKEPELENIDDTISLDDAGVFDMLATLRRRPLMAGEKDVRLSLAGAQDKVAVRIGKNAGVSLMRGGAPTTHIIKPMISDAHDVIDSVQNELFCLKLAAAVGLPVADAFIGYAKDEPYLCVERYDRKKEDGRVLRLHQEDFCQALSVPPEHKYESEGGPSISACDGLIQRHSVRPAQDKMVLLRLVMFNYLIGNSDAHGKNFSLLYKDGKPSLAPAYDLLCTTVYPNLAKKMAMKVGGKYNPDHVFIRHWEKLVPDTALAQKAMSKDINKMCGAIVTGAVEVKDKIQKQGVKSEVIDKIIAIIQSRADQIRM